MDYLEVVAVIDPVVDAVGVAEHPGGEKLHIPCSPTTLHSHPIHHLSLPGHIDGTFTLVVVVLTHPRRLVARFTRLRSFGAF